LSYSFLSGERVTEWFSIDEASGLLTTKEPLDREVKDIRLDPRVSWLVTVQIVIFFTIYSSVGQYKVLAENWIKTPRL